MKQRAVGALVAFMVIMLCLGMLSRAVDDAGVALVAAQAPHAQAIGAQAEPTDAEPGADAEDPDAEEAARPAEYRTCVPVTALRKDEHERDYVLVVEERAGFLGSELVARRVNVGVRDRDAENAALDDGSIASSQQVIVRADREVGEGDRVRWADARE